MRGKFQAVEGVLANRGHLVCTLVFAIGLSACSTNPRVEGGSSIQDFARKLNGRSFSFETTGKIFVPSMSGEPVMPQRIPRGLLVALAPAMDHCKQSAGELSYTKFQSAGELQLPQRVVCMRGTSQVWALEIAYLDVGTRTGEDAMGRPTLRYLTMTTRTDLLSAEALASRMQSEQAQALAAEAAATKRREREAADELERQRIARMQEAEARRLAAEWPARVAEFRSRLKPGDRFRWTSPPGAVGSGPFVGMVIRVEGELVFVQFENLKIGGQQTRFVRKNEIEPFDGPTPSVRFELP